MTPITPDFLSAEDQIAIVAPAGPVKRNDLMKGLPFLQQYTTVFEKGVFDSDGYLTGNDSRRTAIVHRAFDDHDIKAIVAARGGSGTTRIIDRLDFTRFGRKPLWFVGCSDLTAVHLTLWSKLSIRSIHGPMVAGFHRTEPSDITRLTQILSGDPVVFGDCCAPVAPGESIGPLIGGNLMITAHMCGTIDVTTFEGAILFLEDVGERPYRLDRCMVQLRRSGILDRLSGVVLGEFSNCSPGHDSVTVDQVMKHHLCPLGIPICAEYPAAHGQRNLPFIHGGTVSLKVNSENATLIAS